MTTPFDHGESHLSRALRAGHFVLTAEITPPASCEAHELLARALPLKNLADAVNVTDGASARTHMSALAASALMAREGIEPILQMTCRDRNRIALQSDLLGAAALGLRNILFLYGDPPEAGDQPDAKPVYDLTTDGLVATARQIRDESLLPGGRAISGTAPFFIGGADALIDPPANWKPSRLMEKRNAGIDFVQTQFCMDANVVRRYIARLADTGIVPDLFFIIGIAPLRSAHSARWMRDKLFGTIIPDSIISRMEGASDPVAEGVAIARELISELATIDGVAGAHLMAPRNESVLPDLLTWARRNVPRTTPAKI